MAVATTTRAEKNHTRLYFRCKPRGGFFGFSLGEGRIGCFCRATPTLSAKLMGISGGTINLASWVWTGTRSYADGMAVAFWAHGTVYLRRVKSKKLSTVPYWIRVCVV
jgi:hypothetical protein